MDIFGRMPHKAVIIFVAEAAESLGFRVVVVVVVVGVWEGSFSAEGLLKKKLRVPVQGSGAKPPGLQCYLVLKQAQTQAPYPPSPLGSLPLLGDRAKQRSKRVTHAANPAANGNRGFSCFDNRS